MSPLRGLRIRPYTIKHLLIMKKLKLPIFILASLLILSSLVSNYFEITKNLEIFNNIYRELEKSYVEKLNPGELMEKTIDNMLNTLDPWTVYIPESEVEDYRERSITGEYGGIGSKIRKVDNYVVIAEPFQGSPSDKANLKIGDNIIEINGEKMIDLGTEDVSELLRGSPGTNVQITLKSPEGNIKSVDITREKIQTKTVPHYELLINNTAYIKLSQFKRKSAKEVENALVELDSLSDGQLNGLILDLRNNPGGLLRECLQIVNLFVPKNDTILTAKGKNASWNKTYVTKKNALYENLPVVVLINENSASASEIVAGCLQDLDRGLVLGRTSFGKGLIQQNQKLAYNTQLKLTVAKYYTPSGRCIQNSHTDQKGKRKNIEDSLRSVFTTNNGRTVYGGGGINPDIEMRKLERPEIVFSLIKDNHIFKFGNLLFPTIDFPESPKEFKLPIDTYEKFENYLQEDGFNFSVYSEEIISLLEESLDSEKYLESMKDDIELLKENILKNKKEDLIRYKKDINKIISNDMILRQFYNHGVIEYNLLSDLYIIDAMEILEKKVNYSKMLTKE
jgi:carboxyl-terminal processing protease